MSSFCAGGGSVTREAGGTDGEGSGRGRAGGESRNPKPEIRSPKSERRPEAGNPKNRMGQARRLDSRKTSVGPAGSISSHACPFVSPSRSHLKRLEAFDVSSHHPCFPSYFSCLRGPTTDFPSLFDSSLLPTQPLSTQFPDDRDRQVDKNFCGSKCLKLRSMKCVKLHWVVKGG